MANSSAKGKRGENEVVELLKEYWQDQRFVRNWIGASGAVGTMIADNKNVPQHIKEALSSDITCPPGFPFSVESKLYEEIDLYAVIRNPGNCDIAQWWEQCCDDAKNTHRTPLLTFRENRKKRYVMLAKRDLDHFQDANVVNDAGYLETTLKGEAVRIMLWEDFVRLCPKESVVRWKRASRFMWTSGDLEVVKESNTGKENE